MAARPRTAAALSSNNSRKAATPRLRAAPAATRNSGSVQSRGASCAGAGMQPKPIITRGQPLAGGRVPAICAPLVARTPDELAAEAAAVVARQPDLLEWRVDFFAPLA